MKNLIIDGQVLQTAAWHRGMGKYTIQVLQQLSKLKSDEIKITLLFNTSLGIDQQKLEYIRETCPGISCVEWLLPVTDSGDTTESDYIEVLSNNIIASFGDHDNYFLLTSLFTFDFYANFPSSCQKLLLFYDLTPLLFWSELGGYFPADLYMKRFQQILESDLIFSISETTRRDLLKILGIAPENVININGGYSGLPQKSRKPTSLKVPKRYILFPTGDLPHKNNQIAARAFNQYCLRNNSDIKLLVTSNFHEPSKQRLLGECPGVVFTGNVPDDELAWLYEHAEVVLFASKYEGLGIPILDAVYNGKPVIASKISVFEEMSKKAFYFFDPSSVNELSEIFEQALSQRDFKEKFKSYSSVAHKYTWENTGSALLKAVLSQRGTTAAPRKIRSRIAIVSLHPSIGEGISWICEPLYSHLYKDYDMDFYFDANGVFYKDMERPTFLDHLACDVYDIGKFTLSAYKDYDEVLYVLDDVAVPSRAWQRSCVLPGLMLHNFSSKDTMRLLALESQDGSHSITGGEYADLQRLVKWVNRQVKSKRTYHETTQRIIRDTGGRRSIVNQLLQLRQGSND